MDCPKVAGSSVRHASTAVPKVPWITISPSCPAEITTHQLRLGFFFVCKNTAKHGCAYQNDGDVREPIVRVADVRQPTVVQQYLLQYEGGHRFAQLRSGLHDAQAQWNDFRRQQKRDHFLFVGLRKKRMNTPRQSSRLSFPFLCFCLPSPAHR